MIVFNARDDRDLRFQPQEHVVIFIGFDLKACLTWALTPRSFTTPPTIKDGCDSSERTQAVIAVVLSFRHVQQSRTGLIFHQTTKNPRVCKRGCLPSLPLGIRGCLPRWRRIALPNWHPSSYVDDGRYIPLHQPYALLRQAGQRAVEPLTSYPLSNRAGRWRKDRFNADEMDVCHIRFVVQ